MRTALVFALVYSALAALLVVVAVEPVPTMLLPPALCGAPLLARGARAVRRASLAALLLLALFVLAGIASVGGLFVPSAIALAVASAEAAKAAARAGAPGGPSDRAA